MVLILFYFSCIDSILKESVKPLCVGVKNPNSSSLFLPWQSKEKLTGCCCLLVLLNSLVLCRVSIFLLWPKRQWWSVHSSTLISLSDCAGFIPTLFVFFSIWASICFLNFSTRPGIADTRHLKKLCSLKKKRELDRKWQPKQIITRARARELLPCKSFSSRKHRHQRALGQWARGKLWNTLSMLWQQRMTVCATCVWVFIHHFPWKVSCSRVGGGWFWVGCG